MSRQAINARGAAAVGPYSHAVVAGDLIFLSGPTPIDPSTSLLVEGSIAQQTDQCLQSVHGSRRGGPIVR
jgi:2-iminobutanoate/2-iminopropanoate deaminase